MNNPELTAFFEAFTGEQREIMVQKGQSYSGSTDDTGDRLANFKRVAKQMGVRDLQAWLCYLLKHVDSVCTYVRTGHEDPTEPIRGRFLDLANYAILGAALVAEAQAPDNHRRHVDMSNKYSQTKRLKSDRSATIVEVTDV